MGGGFYRDFVQIRADREKAARRKRRWIIAVIVVAIVALAVALIYELGGFSGPGASSPQASASATPAGAGASESEPTECVTVHFIDVGQGDAIFIELTGGRCMLIDAGENNQGGLVSAYIKLLGYRRIDFLMGTHPHSDHIGGLDTVIESFDIGKVYMPKVEYETKTYEDVLIALLRKDLTVTTARSGVKIIDEDGLNVEILSPSRSSYSSLNDMSAVVRLKYGETVFLFTGDAGEDAERELSGVGRADVIKIGHHGSRTSTSLLLLLRTKPSIAVISLGADNDYGYPHRETMERLAEYGVKVYRTDFDGTVIIKSDGQNVGKAG